MVVTYRIHNQFFYVEYHNETKMKEIIIANHFECKSK